MIVALESKGDKEVLATLARQLAMHVASANPLALDASGLDPATVEREKSAARREERRQAGECAAEDHRLRASRPTPRRSACSIRSRTIPTTTTRPSPRRSRSIEGKAGAPIAIKGFERYALGEGIEKQTSDFAAEVAAAAKG